MHEVDRTLVKVATLYYRENLTQQQVADRLGLSRQNVGRLLQRARDLNVVQIEIRSPISSVTDLELQLERAFGLKEAIVVEPLAQDDEAIKEAIGQAAADFLRRRLRSNDILGVSWSSTVYQVARCIGDLDVENLTIVGLNGSLNVTSYPTHAEYVIHTLAEAARGTGVLLPVPMFVERAYIKDVLLTDSSIASALDLARQSSVALFGIGDLSEQSSPYKAGYVNDETLALLLEQRVVGDICGRFFDIEGQPSVPELAERTIAIELSTLLAKRLAIGVAGGLRKVDAIQGALRGRFCNVLVTDRAAAQELIARAG